jgi:hypothetical protein
MTITRTTTAFIAGAALALAALPASALVLGQIDTFEDGTVQSWIVAPLGASHPAPPQNVPDGGPTGVGDNYLELTAVGGAGAGSKLAVLNLDQWAGDYTSAGIGGVILDARNLGSTDLHLRLLLEDPGAGPPLNVAITDAVIVPAQGGWTTAMFSLDPADLTVLLGDVMTLLSNTTAMRIIHNPDPTFPPPEIAAVLGVDNIEAVATVTPVEPSSWGRLKRSYR